LQWVAYGKTSYEISIIVGLSERTVNFHVAGAIAKLNAANRTHAAVKAALMGLITVD
jgi:DNA-binding CsgD family transcriptional regulator